jgi:hypothetical protein
MRHRTFASLCLLPVLNLSCLLLATPATVTETSKVIDLGLFSGDDRGAVECFDDAARKLGQGEPVVTPIRETYLSSNTTGARSPAFRHQQRGPRLSAPADLPPGTIGAVPGRNSQRLAYRLIRMFP